MGHKIAYGADLFVIIIQIMVLASLKEVCAGKSGDRKEGNQHRVHMAFDGGLGYKFLPDFEPAK